MPLLNGLTSYQMDHFLVITVDQIFMVRWIRYSLTFGLQSKKRPELVKFLKDKGIGTGIYYPIPLHLQKAYKDLGYKEGDLPNAESLSHRTFAIPVFPELTEEEKDYIVRSLRGFGS